MIRMLFLIHLLQAGAAALALAVVLAVACAPQAWAETATELDCNECVETRHIAKEAVSKDRLKDKAVTKKKIKDEAVTKKKIKDKAVTKKKIKDASVTEDKIKDESVTEDKIAEDAVTENKIAGEAVSEGEIQDDAVNGAKVANGSLTGEDIANGTITADDLGPGSVGAEELSTGIAAGVIGVEFDNSSESDGTETVLTNTAWRDVANLTTTVPAPGFVTCIATGSVRMGTGDASLSTIDLGWDLSGSGQADTYVQAVGRNVSEDFIRMPITAMRTFELAGTGSKAFSLYVRCESCSTSGYRVMYLNNTACMYFRARL